MCNGCIRPSAGTRSRENGHPGVFEQTRAPSPFKFHTGWFLRPTWLGYMYGDMYEKLTIDRLVDYRPEKADYRLLIFFKSRLSTFDFWTLTIDYRRQKSTFALHRVCTQNLLNLNPGKYFSGCRHTGHGFWRNKLFKFNSTIDQTYSWSTIDYRQSTFEIFFKSRPSTSEF